MESYIYEQIRYSNCSNNDYYKVYISFFVDGKKTIFQKSLNKIIYKKEDAYTFIQNLINKYGDPLPPINLSRRKKIIYSPNYRGVITSI